MAYMYGDRPVNKDIITNTETYNTSERYNQVSTQQVIDEMNQYGKNFKIMNFSQANVRKKDKRNKQSHLLMLQGDGSELIAGNNMQIALANSSDRSSALKLHIGVFRAICLNGMILGEEFMEPISIRHLSSEANKDNWKHSVASLMDEYENIQLRTSDMIERMMNKRLSYYDMAEFATKVSTDILSPVITGDLVDPLQMLVAQRSEDVGKDLYRTYNKIQEYAIQGGLHRIIKKTDPDEPSRIVDIVSNTHKITDTDKVVKINKQIHSLAMEIL